MFKKILLVCLMLVLGLGQLSAAGAEIVMETDVIKEAQDVILSILSGDIDTVYDRMNDEVKEQISRDKVAMIGEQLVDLAGEFRDFAGVQRIGTVVLQSMQMERMNLLGQVGFDADNKISSLGFVPDTELDTTLADNEEEVAVGEYALAGILTIPQEPADTYPAVVLVHGSGPNDRNETYGVFAPFKDIAEGLSQKGIAVLRYDKRTYAMGQGLIPYTQEELDSLTFDAETIEDAVAAVQLLREDSRIDPDRIYLLGHSLGGILAGRIQESGANADGLIIMAGTLRHLVEVLADQLEVMDAGTGALEAEIELARSLGDMTEQEARSHTLLGNSAYQMWEELKHDLVAAAEKVDVPMLILQGTEDTKVYTDTDYVLWESFAADHPEKDIELHLYEGLGHEFIDMDTSKVSQQVIDDIARWLMEK